MLSTVIFIVGLLHLAAGFGYLLFKLSPSKKEVLVNEKDKTTI
jgi:hypothetical protein